VSGIYFIQQGDDGPIKIGTSDNPEKRLQQLQGSHHETLRLLKVVEGSNWAEKRLHQHLAAFRLRGEWFENCAEVLRVVEIAEAMVNEMSRTRSVRLPLSVTNASTRARELAAIHDALVKNPGSEDDAADLFAEVGREIWRARQDAMAEDAA